MGSNRNFNIGELVILGFQGQSVSAETRKTIQTFGINNVILFGPNNPNNNYASKSQLISLTDELQSIHGNDSLPMIVSADQEGGRVQRFRNDFTLLPSAMKIADQGSREVALKISRIQASELFAAGIQLNFAPVCDINTNPANPVIGDRAYGSTESAASPMVTAVVEGHLAEGVQPCIKHFPGHGDTNMDSHYALPTVHTALEVLRAREWIPFRKAMQSGCNFVMSAHILLPHVDPDRPGTLSNTFLKKHLREELDYQGVIVSDDMQMHAITHHYGVEEAPILALEAGCDLLCYRTEDATTLALQAIEKAIMDGRLSVEKLNASVERTRKIRSKIQLAKNSLSVSDRLARIGSNDHLAFVEQYR
jgi:beta-N-acetylhexosaminidase